MNAIVATPITHVDPNWYPSTGATYLTTDLENLNLSAKEYIGSDQICIGDSTSLPIKQVGSYTLPTSHTTFCLPTLLYVPSIRKILLY